MKREAVKSSNIKSVGYDPQTETLEVEFVNGTVYQYVGVEADKHAAMMKSDTVGGYFNAHIKGGGYKFTKH